MSRVLSGHFKTYLAALEKMEAAVAGACFMCRLRVGRGRVAYTCARLRVCM
jgi:hypothetical protein